jgi:hypothetical protein
MDGVFKNKIITSEIKRAEFVYDKVIYSVEGNSRTS